MMSEEDSVIDGVGRAQPPRAVTAAGEAAARATTAPRAGEANVAAPKQAMVSNLGRVAKELAASPPVDTARVEALRLAIASGDYKPDPDRIAAAMIALETPPKA
jgi:negative regulator of flagellin synthesis FlgM